MIISLRSTKAFAKTSLGKSLPRPSRRTLTTEQQKTKDLEKIVEVQYINGHTPLAQKKPYGAPYTDTSVLEKWPAECYNTIRPQKTIGDKAAYGLVEFFKVLTHLFFRNKYAHHAVVLETVAAVPGMVAGMIRHMRSLRTMKRDHGWIGKLLEEAENERMHLLTWMQICQPTFTERLFVLGAQGFYFPLFAGLYIVAPKTAHRFVGYLEEEACKQYTLFLEAIDRGEIPNVEAPEIAKKYWNLSPDSRLRDVVLAVRADEAMHRNAHHTWSDHVNQGIQALD